MTKDVYHLNLNDAEAAWELSALLNRRGDFYGRRGEEGDGERALGYYEKAVAIAERVCKLNSEDAEAARGLSVLLRNLGTFRVYRRAKGHAERLLQCHEKVLAIAQHIYDLNPNDAQAARSLAAWFQRVGDDYASGKAEGDAERAVTAYEKMLECAQRSYDLNPDDAEAARSLVLCHNRLAEVMSGRSRPDDAHEHLRRMRGLLVRMRTAGMVLDSFLESLLSEDTPPEVTSDPDTFVPKMNSAGEMETWERPACVIASPPFFFVDCYLREFNYEPEAHVLRLQFEAYVEDETSAATPRRALFAGGPQIWQLTLRDVSNLDRLHSLHLGRSMPPANQWGTGLTEVWALVVTNNDQNYQTLFIETDDYYGLVLGRDLQIVQLLRVDVRS